MSFRLTLALFAMIAAGRTARAQDQPVITLRRTACLGRCPVYSLEIFEDGFIRYVGIEYVQAKGERRAVVPRDAVENLVASFLRADYFALQDSYETCIAPDGSVSMVSDLPSQYTSLRVATRKKSVRNYVCAPRRLRELETEIDRVANTKRWIGSNLLNVPPPKL